MARDKKKKKKLTKSQLRRRGVLAEQLKGKPGIDEPFALATFLAKKKKKKTKRRR